MSRRLRIAGKPPVIAQAPMATRILALARNSRNTCTFSALHTPPSISAISQGPQCLMSVNGDRSNSAIFASSNMRSSMSRNDVWQPKQPASEVVAMRTLGRAADFADSLIWPPPPHPIDADRSSLNKKQRRRAWQNFGPWRRLAKRQIFF